VRVALFGHRGKVGSVLGPALAAAGHMVTGIGRREKADLTELDAAVDFTQPDAVRANVTRAIDAGVPCIVGTTGLSEDDLVEIDGQARARHVACLVAPNFAVGAVLMMRFAEEAARSVPRTEIIELHHESKRDAPSGTARTTAARLGGDVPIHSVRLPGLVAHQEVVFGSQGEVLTIRHDVTSREAFVPGVLLALERLSELPHGLTVGIDGLVER
jgi:4-hydroxy-tetrahydrodipicolinate reductase